jgi:transposase
MTHIPKRKTTKVTDKKFWYYIYNKTKREKRIVVERINVLLKSFKRLRMRFNYNSTSFKQLLLSVSVNFFRKNFSNNGSDLKIYSSIRFYL